MAKGTVKWFNNKKGYGFITSEEGDDIFVHFSNIQAEGFKTLAIDQEVFFEIEPGKKGPIAKNITSQ